MPRIRSIKPEFFQDEDIAALSPLDRLVFVGLWTQADREGRLEDRPTRLKIQIAPYDDFDMAACLDRLIAAGFLIRYPVGERSYLLVRSFLKHQRPHPSEQASVLPPWDNVVRTCFDTVQNARKGEGKGKEEGKEEGREKGKDMTPTESCRQEPTAPGEEKSESSKSGPDLPPFALAWNRIVDGSPLPRVTKWTTARGRALKARLAEEPDLAVWERAMELLRDSPHHRGENDRGWVANVDFLLQAGQGVKWVEKARAPVAETVDPGLANILRGMRAMGGGA